MTTTPPAPDQGAAPTPTAPAPYTLPPGHVLALRVCAPGMTSHNGFEWPESGPVAAPDWDPKPECGHGLHGWLWGAGDVTSCGGTDRVDGARWLVVEVPSYVELNGKIKFPSGRVVYCGDVAGATALVAAHAPAGTAIIYGTATAGDRGTATAGDRGTATAGDRGTATAGEEGAIIFRHWNGSRCLTVAGNVGIDGIEANVKYRCEGGKIVRAE